jgi:hypothetical protein
MCAAGLFHAKGLRSNLVTNEYVERHLAVAFGPFRDAKWQYEGIKTLAVSGPFA